MRSRSRRAFARCSARIHELLPPGTARDGSAPIAVAATLDDGTAFTWTVHLSVAGEGWESRHAVLWRFGDDPD